MEVVELKDQTVADTIARLLEDRLEANPLAARHLAEDIMTLVRSELVNA